MEHAFADAGGLGGEPVLWGGGGVGSGGVEERAEGPEEAEGFEGGFEGGHDGGGGGGEVED